MIQVQNVQQQPSQDVREQLYSQLEDYLGLSSTKKKMDSSEKSGGTTLKRKSSEQLEQQLQSAEQKHPCHQGQRQNGQRFGAEYRRTGGRSGDGRQL